MKKILLLTLPMLYLFIMACGGSSSPPPTPPQVLASPEAKEADDFTRATIETCTGIAQQGYAAAGGAAALAANPNYIFAGDSKCYDDLIVAMLLWKSAPLRRGPPPLLAINDPDIRDRYLPALFRGALELFVRRNGYSRTDSLLLANHWYNGFNNHFKPRVSSRVGPDWVAGIQPFITMPR